MQFYKDINEYQAGEQRKLERLLKANIPSRGIITKVLRSDASLTRESDVSNYSITKEVAFLEVNAGGIVGDRHYGQSRPSTGREHQTYSKGTLIRQHRHIFAVSPYDCQILGEKLGVEVTPELLGANLVIEREDGEDYSLSALPNNTYLFFGGSPLSTKSGNPRVTLVNHVKQRGCGVTGNTLAKKYNDKSLTRRFIEHSRDNRGVIFSIEQPVRESERLSAKDVVHFCFPMNESI